MKRNPCLRPGHLVSFLSLLLIVGLLAAKSASAARGNIYLITANPELEETTNNFGGFLRGLGYHVEVEPPGGGPFRTLDTAPDAAQLIAQITTNELVIVHRNFGSGTLASTPAEIAIWNDLDVPILLCNAPIARNDRWRWINASSGSAQANRNLSFNNPSHPIVAGLQTDLFQADRIYGGIVNGSDGGPHMVQIALAIVPPFSPICLAVWDENNGETRGFYESGGQTFHRRRVFFEMHEYRNGGNWAEITPNGRRLWANTVAYAMTGQVPPEPPQILDISPAPGSSFNSSVTSLSFRVTSSAPIEPEGIRVVINGTDVSAGLDIAGPSTSRMVTHSGLVVNQVYNVEITATNLVGSRIESIQFDTFRLGDVISISSNDQVTYSDFVPPDVYQAYVQATSMSAQDVRLLQTFPVGDDQLCGVVYLPGNTTGSRIVPLTDALGQPALLRNTNNLVSFEVVPKVALTLGQLFLIPVASAPAVLPPILAQTSPIPSQSEVAPTATLTLTLAHRDTRVQLPSVRLFLNDAEVTGTADLTATQTALGAEVNYDPPAFLEPSAMHTVTVLFSDNAVPANTISNRYSFQTVNMPAIPTSVRSPLNSGRLSGFNLLVHMAPGNPDNVFTNTAARAELQLAGMLVGPSGPVTNQISGTTGASPYHEGNVLNYNRVVADTGQFPGDVLFPFGDVVTPSLMALEARAFLALAPGIHKFGVRSDDGFKLTVGGGSGVVLGVYEGPRGDQVPSEFEFLVYEVGLYPIKLIYNDGGGGASLEFYAVHQPGVNPDTGGRLLINGKDMEGDTPVPAYRELVPSLSISRQGNQIVIEWSSTADDQLQESMELGSDDWSPVVQSPEVTGTLHVVRIPAPASGHRFFRLALD